MVLRVTKWFPYSSGKFDLINYLDDDSYKIIDTKDLYYIIPEQMHGYLKNNIFGDQHLVVKKVDEESRSTFAFSNIIRIDEEKGKCVVNEDQWAVFWLSGQSTASDSGAFMQHGEYIDRTRPVDASVEFVRNVLDSSIDLHIPISSIPITPAGSIDELKSTSHWYAADALQRWIDEK